MTEFDITVAVTAHSETVVAGPPMRSAEKAIRAAESEGFHVERLIGLDTPSNDCRAFFDQMAFEGWRTVEFQVADPSRARNTLVEIATGRWMAFLDADDLFSENWLAAAAKRLAQAEKTNDKVIVHPEVSWIFDGYAFVYTKPTQNDPLFTPHYFYFRNYYDMPSMSPRAAHLETPYAPRNIQNGFGHEDWQWNIETMAAGWRHVVAADTIIFMRRRDMSICTETEALHGIIWDVEPMAIDRIANLGRTSAVVGAK